MALCRADLALETNECTFRDCRVFLTFEIPHFCWYLICTHACILPSILQSRRNAQICHVNIQASRLRLSNAVQHAAQHAYTIQHAAAAAQHQALAQPWPAVLVRTCYMTSKKIVHVLDCGASNYHQIMMDWQCTVGLFTGRRCHPAVKCQ